jgi:antitoxin (DNA-binding transcriptional repressor) of toxin-antitoxin stability system
VDINENLKKQRELASKLLAEPLEGEPLELLELGIELARLVTAADQHLSSDGSYPEDWLSKPKPPAHDPWCGGG